MTTATTETTATTATTDVIVIGGKGTAINVAEQIEDARVRFGHPMRCVGFAIDDPALGSSVAGFPVVCGTRDLGSRDVDPALRFLFCLYRPDVLGERYRLLQGLGIADDRFARFIHPQAYVSRSASLGVGSIVLAGASIQSQASVGRHCIVNSGVVVEHEARIDDGCFIAAQACIGARASLGASVFIGLSAAVREDVRIGRQGFVGMSSTVLADVGDGAVVYGTPARPRR